MAATKNDTLPMAPALGTDSHSQSADTQPDGVPRATDSRATDPSTAPVGPSGPEAENLEAILQNMAPARIWSPNALIGAESKGADFAAYRAGAHAAAKAHDEKPAEARVVVDVTSPDLAALVEQAHARQAERRANEERGAPTVEIHPGPSEQRAPRKQKVVVFALALGLSGGVGLFVLAKAENPSRGATSAIPSAPQLLPSAKDPRPGSPGSAAAPATPEDATTCVTPDTTPNTRPTVSTPTTLPESPGTISATARLSTPQPLGRGPSASARSPQTAPLASSIEPTTKPAPTPPGEPRSRPESGSGKDDTNGWRL